MSEFRDIMNYFGDAREHTDSDIAAATLVLAYEVAGVYAALYRLGNADAATRMGGLEGLGAAVKEAGDAVAHALSEVSESVSDAAGD